MLQTIIFLADFSRFQKLKKNRQIPDAEVSAAEMVLREVFAGRIKSSLTPLMIYAEEPCRNLYHLSFCLYFHREASHIPHIYRTEENQP